MKAQQALDNQASGSMIELKAISETADHERRWDRERRTKYVAGLLQDHIENVLTQHRRA